MFKSRFLAGAALAAGLVLSATAVSAAAQDYRFELADTPAKAGESTIVKVRLVHVNHGHAIDGAVIFQTRFDMGPDGMATMTAPAKPVPGASKEPGVYVFETRPSMAGKWALTVSAKVQGEAETVRGTITLSVGK